MVLGSVANFYSPLESPANSDDEEEDSEISQDSGIKIPRRNAGLQVKYFYLCCYQWCGSALFLAAFGSPRSQSRLRLNWVGFGQKRAAPTDEKNGLRRRSRPKMATLGGTRGLPNTEKGGLRCDQRKEQSSYNLDVNVKIFLLPTY